MWLILPQKYTTMLGLIGGLGSTLLGGIMSGVQARKAETARKEEEARKQAEFDKRYYQDVMQRSDVSAILNKARENLGNVNRRAEASAVVTGATPEAVVAQKAANANAYADTISGLVVNTSAMRDNLYQQHEQDRNAMYQANQQALANRANSWANIATTGLQLAGNSLAQYLDAKKLGTDTSTDSNSEGGQ